MPQRSAAVGTPVTFRRYGRRPSVETRLLAAVERLLAAGHAFGSVSVEALVAEAGIARATFYLHFKDKGALVARLLGQITDEVVASGGTWFRDARNAGPGEVRAALHQQMMDRLCAASRAAVADVRAQGRASAAADDALAD